MYENFIAHPMNRNRSIIDGEINGKNNFLYL